MPDSPAYPWYARIRDNSLEQGDIVRGFEVPNFTNAFDSRSSDYEIELQTLDVVILTQTCDIEHGKARSLVLCPVIALKDFVAAAAARHEEHWKSGKHLDALRQGNIPGYHLISDLEDLGFPISIIDFHELYSASTVQMRLFVSNGAERIRLCPPYKEHMAQAFARFFMRVGLPIDISKEKVKAAS